MFKFLRFLFGRSVIIAFMILLQVSLLLVGVWYLSSEFVFGKVIYFIFVLFSIGVLLYIINKDETPSFKIPWIVIIMVVPMFGGFIYLMFAPNYLTRSQKKKYQKIIDRLHVLSIPDEAVVEKLKQDDKTIYNQSSYTYRASQLPVYQNTKAEYLSSGEMAFEKMLETLEKAQHFIFMEYFIIERGIMWDKILKLLERKVRQGVDVRLMYDDIGCINKLPYRYDKFLHKKGISCIKFNKFRPIVSAIHNNRDHRKIAVIDGYMGFTGGINLADEYINVYERFGHWKDSAIYLEGEAVQNLTRMFLELWNLSHGEAESYDQYLPHVHHPEPFASDGFVQPFGDGPKPTYEEYVGETVYLNIINTAVNYVYITTPYLIVDYKLSYALKMAAERGVDVRIMTPHIFDKKTVSLLTKGSYLSLVHSGVKIYEYTPGFVHAKNFVSDDKVGVVGTINLDYRSLVHHFECAVWLYQSSTICDMKQDYEQTLHKCQQMTVEDCKPKSRINEFIKNILEIFAPLM